MKIHVRNLTGGDYYMVAKMDEDSGFYVSEWLEELAPYEETEYCFGAFDVSTNRILGYATLGYASGALDLATIKVDDALLCDVYVTPEYRGNHVGMTMIRNMLANVTDDVYLTVLHDGLFDYYKQLGFVRVPGTDNVMVKTNET